MICSSSLLFFLQGCKEEFSSLEEEGISQQMIDQLTIACGTSDVFWLEEIIVKAEEDRRSRTHLGNFMGTVYLEAYQDKPVIFARMAMGSGGLYGYVYQCDGSRVDFDDDPSSVATFFSNMKKDQIIYTNVQEINGD